MDDPVSKAIAKLVSAKLAKANRTVEILAERMRARGHPWHRQTFSELKRGGREVRLPELLALVDVLNDLKAPTSDAEMLKAGRQAAKDRYEALTSGYAARIGVIDTESRTAQALSRALGREVTIEDVQEKAEQVWRRSLVDQREHLLGSGVSEGSIQSQRGLITRQLIRELQRAFEEEDR